MPLYLTGNSINEDLAICQENSNNKEYYLAFIQLKMIKNTLHDLLDSEEKQDHLQAVGQQELQLIDSIEALCEQELTAEEKQELNLCISWLLQEKPDHIHVNLIAVKAFYKLEKEQEAQELSNHLLDMTDGAWDEEREKYFLKIRYSLFLLQHNEKAAAEALESWLGLQPNLTPITVIENSVSERLLLVNLYLSLQQEERALKHLNDILEWQEWNKEALGLRCDILKKKGDNASLAQAACDERVLRKLEAPSLSQHDHRMWQDVKYTENRKRKYVREEDEDTYQLNLIRRRTS